MDEQFTRNLKEWLEKPSSERNYEQGALMILQLTHNQIQYRMMMRDLKKFSELIEYNIQKYYNFRVQRKTHEEVVVMEKKVEKIMEKSNASTVKGKRPDHDSLPSSVQALYVENASLLQRIRSLHEKLKLMSKEDKAGEFCQDSDRYPFLQEIIKVHGKYMENWHEYDSATGADGQQNLMDDSIDRERRFTRSIQLLKGKYRKNPSVGTKESILLLFNKLQRPSQSLVDELKDLGIL